VGEAALRWLSDHHAPPNGINHVRSRRQHKSFEGRARRGQSTSGSLPLVAGEAARRRGLGCSTLRAARKVQPGVGLTQTQFAIRQKEEPDTHALRVGLASLGERSSALEVHYGAASKHQLGRGLAQTQFPKKRARRELRLRVGLASCRGKRRGVMDHNAPPRRISYACFGCNYSLSIAPGESPRLLQALCRCRRGHSGIGRRDRAGDDHPAGRRRQRASGSLPLSSAKWLSDPMCCYEYPSN
jgi:hypothetical protein